MPRRRAGTRSRSSRRSRGVDDHVEQVGVVHLAGVGLVPLGHAGDLQVADAAGGQVRAQLHRQVALDDLAVVEVHLHLEVGRADLGQHGVRLVLAVEEVARDVAAC